MIVILAVAVKLAYFIFGYFSGYHADLEILKRNDSYWYEKIAINGHEKITPDQLGSCEDSQLKQSYYAFFPLYPFIIKGAMALTGFSFDKVAFFYSVAFSLLLFLVFFMFIKVLSHSVETAFYSTLVLMLFPFHYYFSVFYTESLFLLLLIAAFYAIEKRRLVLFSGLTALLVLVRPNGLFMMIPLFIFLVEGYQKPDVVSVVKSGFKNYRNLIYFVLPVFTFIAYCTYLKIMTGDFFAYKTAQAGWCRETVFPWVPILRSADGIDYFNSAYFFVFVLIGIFCFNKIPLSFSALIWINLLLPLTANSITSPRFISVIFVFSFIIGQSLHKNRPMLIAALFIVLFLLQLVTFKFWLLGSRFSF